MRKPSAATIAVIVGLALPGRAAALPMAVVSTAATAPQKVAVIDTGTPDVFTHAATAVAGLSATERIVGIDYRPATQTLYALARDIGTGAARLYTLDPLTGVAAAVGPSFGGLATADFDIDFNPVSDRLRVVSTADANLRLNPNDGSLAATDGTLAFAAGDTNAADNPQVAATAYTNSFAGATATTLYDIDFTNRVLAIQNPPNSGTLNTVGSTLVSDSIPVSSLDVADPGNVAYASLTSPAIPSASYLYTVDLPTGGAAIGDRIGPSAGGIRYPFIAVESRTVVTGAADTAVAEDAGAVTLTLTRATKLATTTVSYGTVAGTATAGADFTTTAGTLTFAPGEQSKTITIPIADDTSDEGAANETFRVNLTSTNSTVSPGSTLVAIVDNDAPKVVPTAEDKPPTVTLATAPSADLPVFSTVGLSATAADDAKVDRVVFMDGTKTIATDATAPYSATYTPTAVDIGRRTLLAIAFDSAGQSAVSVLDRSVVPIAPTLTASTTPKKDVKGARTFTTKGTLAPGAACAGAKVTVRFASGSATASRKTAAVGADCRFTSKATLKRTGRLKRKKTLTVAVTIAATTALKAAAAPPATVRVR